MEHSQTTKRGHLSGKRKLAIWEREKGRCMICNEKLLVGGFIYEHVIALELSGTDTDDNIRLTCKPCAKEKTKKDHQMTAKAKRTKQTHLGLKESRSPLPYGKTSKWKRKLDGTVVPR